jgi:membrane peptidoglycan carboxypeptidase
MQPRLAALRLVAAVVMAGVLVATAVILLAPLVGGVANAVDTEPPTVDLDRLDDFAVRSYVYADDGALLATLFGPENRQPVALADVPDPVVESILAVEDNEFWNHGGVNVLAIGRALFRNVDSGGVAQGGSTITQQLVKNALLNSDTTLNRKTREAALALELERQVTKEEILETYLNTVYFGSGAYGVQAAAETYWGLSVSELGWVEGSLLAGLIANPSRFDPFTNPEAAAGQRTLALQRLVELDKLTAEEAAFIDAFPMPEQRCSDDNSIGLPQCNLDQVAPSTGNYFVEDVRQALLTDPRYGLGDTAADRAASLYGGGLRITTTLDPALQLAAEQTAAAGVPANDLGVTAAMVSIENETGAVRSMVGGPGYDQYRYNVVSQLPGRQTGSTFKTFVLLTALAQGAVPADSVAGGGSFPNPAGTPNPYNITGAGGTLTSITAGSSNGGYVRLGQIVGLPEVGETAERMGLRTDFGDYPISLPLGTLLTTPMDMASSFSAIANEGVRNPWYLIEKVEDANGNVLYTHEPEPTRALTRQVACLATNVLTEVVRSGTATRARLPNQVAAGKTGTTERNSDAWFVGFTPYLTTAVWMGNPDANVSMANLGGVANFGGTFPAALWREFNTAYHADRPPLPFPTCEPQRPGRSITSSEQFTAMNDPDNPRTNRLDEDAVVDEQDEDPNASAARASTTTTTVRRFSTVIPLPTITTAPPPTGPPVTRNPDDDDDDDR